MRNGIDSVLARNIRTLHRRRAADGAKAGYQERLANAITRFTGSMIFAYVHLVLYGAWIVLDSGLIHGIPRFDPSFSMLAMVASVEALFLTTFVLISQNRMAEAADKRDELDLQITLLSEHEITRIVSLVAEIAERMNIDTAQYPELEELKRDIAPDVVLEEIERQDSAC